MVWIWVDIVLRFPLETWRNTSLEEFVTRQKLTIIRSLLLNLEFSISCLLYPSINTCQAAFRLQVQYSSSGAWPNLLMSTFRLSLAGDMPLLYQKLYRINIFWQQKVRKTIQGSTYIIVVYQIWTLTRVFCTETNFKLNTRLFVIGFWESKMIHRALNVL